MTSAAERLATFAGVLNPDATVPAAVVADLPGGPGATHTHVWGETPGGAVNGNNAVFTLVGIPLPAASLQLSRNGLLLRPGIGNDFILALAVITFVAGNFPQPGDDLVASYTT